MSINDILNNKALIPFLMYFVVIPLVLSHIYYKIKNKIKNKHKENATKELFKKELLANISGRMLPISEKESDILVCVKNRSPFDILAIEIYVEEYNIYGQKLNLRENPYLIIEETISNGETKNFKLTTSGEMVKKTHLYFYSVYYSDNTFWGCKEADQKTITSNSYLLILPESN